MGASLFMWMVRNIRIIGCQDGGEELEDPALVGISTCFHCPIGEDFCDFQQRWRKGGR